MKWETSQLLEAEPVHLATPATLAIVHCAYLEDCMGQISQFRKNFFFFLVIPRLSRQLSSRVRKSKSCIGLFAADQLFKA